MAENINSDSRIPDEHARNLVDPKAYADGRIHATHAWLRKNNPVGYAEVEGFDPFWVITRHEDVRAISRDNKLFPYGDRPSQLMDQASEKFMRAVTGGKPYMGRSLIAMDPPDHAKYRMLTQAWFMPKNLRTLEQRIGAIADVTAAKLRSLPGACDFVTDIALYYPLEVIMEILGISKEDLPFMLRLTQEIFAPSDPESTPEGVNVKDPAFFAQAMKATVDNLDAYFKKITDDRRRNPRNDIATVIANAQIDGHPMPDVDALGYYGIIATAGHDTTSSSMAAAMYALATQPELLPRLQRSPDSIPALIEEAVRWAAPVKTFMRSAAEDMEFRGRQFRKGDWIKLCYASANRDESVFVDGDRFDIDRPKADHLSFGYGPHSCLGQHLARQEMRALFERIVPMLKSVRLAGEAVMSESNYVNGLKHLPITFELEDERR